jgi:hypothetical protein
MSTEQVERQVQEHGGAAVGMSVRVTEAWLARLRAGQVDTARIEGVGVVRTITLGPEWDSVEVHFGEHVWHFSASQLRGDT